MIDMATTPPRALRKMRHNNTAYGPGATMSESAIAVCATCGMPIRVVFDDDGEVEKVFAVCGHPKAPDASASESTEAPEGNP